MKQFNLLLSFSTILLIGSFSCNQPKEIVTEQLDRSFILGSGGGFTGAYETYRIHNSGKIEQQSVDFESYSFLKKIPADSAVVCFKALDALGIEDYTFDQPGNMTYFIELNGAIIKWGKSGHTIRKDIDIFFKRTRKMVRAEYR